MSSTTLITLVNSLENGKADAPSQIKIMPIGLVKSLKGDFLVDTQAYNSILNNFKSHQVDIPVDYEHQTLQNVQAPAAGWIKEIMLKSDGVYAVVEWTDKAAQYIKEKEYRYLSPVVSVRETDRRALLLHSVALTNTPAIDGMTAIANSAKGDTFSDMVKGRTDDKASSDKMDSASNGTVMEDPTEFIKRLRKIFQLPEDTPISDIENCISELIKGTSKLNLEVNSMHFEAHKQQANDVVTMALKSGKITPYQKDWAFRSAMSNLQDFSDWVKNAPQVVPMGEMAFEPMTLKAPTPSSRANELMGLSADDVKRYGSNR